MQRHCRVEVDRGLPTGLHDELDRRFGPLDVRDQPDRTVVSGFTLDQAGLRALLVTLWEAGVHVVAVTTTEVHPRRAVPPRVNVRREGARPPRRK